MSSTFSKGFAHRWVGDEGMAQSVTRVQEGTNPEWAILQSLTWDMLERERGESRVINLKGVSW